MFDKKKMLPQAIKEYHALDHGSVKRWRKGSWEGRVRLFHDPLHKTKIAVELHSIKNPLERALG